MDHSLFSHSHAALRVTEDHRDATSSMKGWQRFRDLAMSTQEELLQLLCAKQ